MSDKTPLAAPTAERLLEVVAAIEGRPVAVVADLVVDRFISGTPKRISREAPVLILRQEGDERRPGGGANAIANAASLGGSVTPVGLVGDDENGSWLRGHLVDLAASDAGLTTRAGYRTPTKTRILGGFPGAVKQQIVRFDVEDAVELTAAEIDTAVATVCAARPAIVLLSDYGYGAVTPQLARALRKALPEATRIVCDSRFRLPQYDSVDGATPNLEEVEAIVGGRIDSDRATLVAAGRRILSDRSLEFLLITRGSTGMAFFDPSGVAAIPVHGTDQVADVTGAGDTVIATLALALAAGATPLESALVANYAGGIVVMKAGTATLDRHELRRAIESDPLPIEGVRWVAS